MKSSPGTAVRHSIPTVDGEGGRVWAGTPDLVLGVGVGREVEGTLNSVWELKRVPK